jgi:hypothetical protein
MQIDRIFSGLFNTPAWTSAFYHPQIKLLIDELGPIYDQTNATFPGSASVSFNYSDFNMTAPQDCGIFAGENLTVGKCNFDQPMAYPLCDNRALTKYKR